MSRQREQAECCEYREKRRLAAKELRKKMKKQKPNDQIDDCHEDEEEIEEQRECDEKRSRIILPKLISWAEELMGRIKPSIGERDKYSIDHRHIRCFLEAAEIAKLEYEERMLKISQRAPSSCDSYPAEKIEEKKKKGSRPSKKKDKKKKDKEKNEEESQAVVDDQEDNEESSPENVEEAGPSETKGDGGKRTKGEFWCSEPKKKEKIDPNKRRRWQDEPDCKDSICSFDSQINLSGLALTKNDMKKIAETRRKRANSKAQRDKSNEEIEK